jgi:hypothetical protein
MIRPWRESRRPSIPSLSMPDAGPAGRPVLSTAPLTFQQEQLWLVEQAGGGAPYNEIWALRMAGHLDITALARSLDLLADRHESLRTTFEMVNAEPVQTVRPRTRPVLAPQTRDFSGLAPERRDEALRQFMRRFAADPFDLAAGPLMRCCLGRLDTEDHVLLLCVHHIVCDGQSLRVLLSDLQAAYGEFSLGRTPRLAPVPARYAEFARRQRALPGTGAWNAALAYWNTELAGAPTVLDLSPDEPRPPVKSYGGRRDSYGVEQVTGRSLARLAQRASGSRMAALLATFAALVYRYTGRRDMLVGTGTDGRPGRAFDGTVGFFANILPVRLRLADGSAPLQQVVDSACDSLFDALDHRAVPFEKLVELAKPDRDPGHTPLIQVICTIWEPGPVRMSFGDLDVALVDAPRDRARFDFMVEHVITPDGWNMQVEYDTALFRPAQVGAMMRHYQRIIDAAAADPGQQVAAVEMLDTAEYAVLSGGDHVVLDRDQNVVPSGASGELWHRGQGQAGEPARVPTGEVARKATDGAVARLGQVQRRLRLGPYVAQLERVEAVLREHGQVQDVAVRAQPGGERRLTAYVVAGDGYASADRDLSAFAASRLPRYLVPASILTVDSLADVGDGVPSAGPAGAGPPASGAADDPALEQMLESTWREVLGIDRIDPDDDFFALGGHSMLASQVAARVTEATGTEVPLLAIFEHPTIRELAAELSGRYRRGATPVRHVTQDPPDRGPSAAELSMAQLGIWVNAQLTLGAEEDFNAALAHRLTGRLDASALEQAFQACVARQPSLRASFHALGDDPVQRFDDAPRVPLVIVDLSDLMPRERLAEAELRARQEARRPFEPDKPPLLRAVLFRLGPEDHILMYAMHHLVTDGISVAVFHRDLAELYAAITERRPPSLPPLRAHYADYIAEERRWLDSAEAERARDGWARQLSGYRELVLPTAAGRQRTSLAVGTHRRDLSREAAAAVADLARRCHATAFMVVSAGLAVVLRDWSGQDDLVVGTQVENRPRAEFNDVMGCFVNVVPLRVDCAHDPTFETMVRRLRDVLVGAYQQQRLPFADVVRAAGARRSYSRMPLLQVTTQWVQPEQLDLRLGGCAAEQVRVTLGISRYELTLFTTPQAGTLSLEFEHARDLWDQHTIDARLGQLVRVLEAGSMDPGIRLAGLMEKARGV